MGFTVTCRELPILMAQLRRTDNELAKDAKREIRKAERPAIQAMRTSAGGAGMMKATRAVKPNNRFTGAGASLGLKVDARIAPNARPLDKPNHGGYNRHPVFGSHNWVDQPARYFFDRGADAGFKACQDGMEEALNAVVRYLARG
jgi:hypothetical protein